jgi:hypothetical protein
LRRDLATQIEPMTHHYAMNLIFARENALPIFIRQNKFIWNSVDFMGSMDSENNLQKVSHQVLHSQLLSSRRKYIYVH